jgi:hypothetical protein
VDSAVYGAIRRLLEDSWIEPVELADKSRDKHASVAFAGDVMQALAQT